METAALEAGEPGSGEPRQASRHERLRSAAAALLSIPCAAALQVIIREIWRMTAPGSGLPERA